MVEMINLNVSVLSFKGLKQCRQDALNSNRLNNVFISVLEENKAMKDKLDVASELNLN